MGLVLVQEIGPLNIGFASMTTLRGGTICLFKMKITPPMPSELRITSQPVSHDATPIEIPVVLTIWIMGIPIRLTTVNGTTLLATIAVVPARVYTDGNLSSVDSGSPILNEQSNMSIGNASGYGGYKAPSATLSGIRISNVARYPNEFTPETNWIVDSNTIAQYLTASEFDGTTLVDEAGGNNNGTHRQGVAASTSCPEEDLDGDGVAAWEDCDDNDATVPSINDSDCNGIADVYGTCDGSETFSVQSVASGREVQGGVIADVDGDGHEDALFNEQLDNKLQIYWGDGTGNFSSSNRTSLSIGRSGGPGAVGDFDNDGDNDIVWGLQDSSTMKRVFNNGNRSFSIQSSSESQGPRNMELIDVNGDGNLDVYIYKRFSSCVARKLGEWGWNLWLYQLCHVITSCLRCVGCGQ